MNYPTTLSVLLRFEDDPSTTICRHRGTTLRFGSRSQRLLSMRRNFGSRAGGIHQQHKVGEGKSRQARTVEVIEAEAVVMQPERTLGIDDGESKLEPYIYVNICFTSLSFCFVTRFAF